MKRLAHNSMPKSPSPGRGIVLSEKNCTEPTAQNKARLKTQQTRQRGTNISIRPSTVFNDAAIRGLIDDWLVPMLVQKFVDGRLVQQSQVEE